MDDMVYEAITRYYDVLGKLGYFKYNDVYKLLLLCFYRDFVFEDYRAILSIEDYKEIDKAMNCLFGSNCLIPYIDYLKMGKLHLGAMTEMASRVKTLEDTNVIKVITNLQGVTNIDAESDIKIMTEE